MPLLEVVQARVVRTCGASGRGDCFLSVREGPSLGAREISRLIEGVQLQVVCQVIGDVVSSSALGTPTSVWSRRPDGSYVSSAYVEAAGFDPLSISKPCL